MVMDKKQAAAVIGVSFHGVGAVSQNVNPEAQAYFVTRDTFLALLDEIAARPRVDLSFDDGYASDVALVLPALIERGLSAKFFPLAGRLGSPGYVDVVGIRALSAAGMTVGSHGMHHRSWRHMNATSRQEELFEARSMIAEAAGTSVTVAACPFGAYDRQVLKLLRSCGYTRVFTSDRQRAQPDAWLQPRYSVTCEDTVQTVCESIFAPRPLYDRLRSAAAVRVKAWR